MRAIVRTITGANRTADPVVLWPLGDTHTGAAGSDEKAFRADVQRVADDPNAYWVGMGDYADLITRHDPRFDTDELADWITVRHLRDIVTAQRDRFLDITRPIWPKCLALLAGNHEGAILRHYERDVYREIVGVMQPHVAAPDVPLALEYEGYLRIRFAREANVSAGMLPTQSLDAYLHHGYGGGKLMGGKALTLGREVGWHNVDLILMGHTHTPLTFPAFRRWIDRTGRVRSRRVTPVITGSYNIQPAYARRAGYAPNGYAIPRVIIDPWGARGLDDPEAVRVII